MDNKLDQAVLRLAELYCDRVFAPEHTVEEISLEGNMGYLRYHPHSIDRVEARAEQWAHSSFFGGTPWTEINPDTVEFVDNKVYVPGEVLGSFYSKAKISYHYGIMSIPEDVQTACSLLKERIEGAKLNNYYTLMPFITPEIAKLLEPYKRIRG